MNDNSLSPETLAQVHLQNIRDVQIGGITDGITPEVAEDIGYVGPERFMLDATVESIGKVATDATSSPLSDEQKAARHKNVTQAREARQAVDPEKIKRAEEVQRRLRIGK